MESKKSVQGRGTTQLLVYVCWEGPVWAPTFPLQNSLQTPPSRCMYTCYIYEYIWIYMKLFAGGRSPLFRRYRQILVFVNCGLMSCRFVRLHHMLMHSWCHLWVALFGHGPWLGIAVLVRQEMTINGHVLTCTISSVYMYYMKLQTMAFHKLLGQAACSSLL